MEKKEIPSFEEAAKVVQKWLIDHGNPHAVAVIEDRKATLYIAEYGVPLEEIDPEEIVEDEIEEPVWKTATGEKIKISELEDAHLINIIRMFHRKAQDFLTQAQLECMTFLRQVNGDMAEFEMEREYDQLLNMTPLEYLDKKTVYGDLLEEAYKRGLKA